MYLSVKLIHIGLALISINLFVLRSALSIMESPLLQKRWLTILPHVIDTFLLAAAIYLMAITQQYPFTDDWLTIKFFALLGYIFLGSMALKRAKTVQVKLTTTLLAVVVFAFIGWTALNR